MHATSSTSTSTSTLHVDEELSALLVSGGDERLTLDTDGRNKYHLDPRSSAGTFHRGSCTCSPIGDEARLAAAAALDRVRSGTSSAAELAAEQRRRLLDIFVSGPHEGADVVFAPSGSDLCYLPLMFSDLVDPGRRIVNVVATSEELGSGSLLAHDARFFAAQTQIEHGLPIADPISDRIDVETVLLPARDERGGIVDQNREIERLIAERQPADAMVVNLVIGSKSGIENGVRIVERHAHEDIIWTVDLCQMRSRPALFEHLLELGCLLLCTGSKFYEAPPFCGAMLVPAQWMRRLATVDASPAAKFAKIFSAHDFPPDLASVGAQLPSVPNPGLQLRWEAALHEMEAFDAVPAQDTAAVIAAWNECVVDRIGRSPTLELLRDQDQTNDSIVSFRVRAVGGGHLDHDHLDHDHLDHDHLDHDYLDHDHLDHDGLAEIHRRLAVDGAPEIEPYRRATIGQPVAYSSGSFLRVAIGSRDARRAACEGFDPVHDLALIDAIERLAECR